MYSIMTCALLVPEVQCQVSPLVLEHVCDVSYQASCRTWLPRECRTRGIRFLQCPSSSARERQRNSCGRVPRPSAGHASYLQKGLLSIRKIHHPQNVLQQKHRQRWIKPQATCTENLVKFGHVVFEITEVDWHTTHKHFYDNNLVPYWGWSNEEGTMWKKTTAHRQHEIQTEKQAVDITALQTVYVTSLLHFLSNSKLGHMSEKKTPGTDFHRPDDFLVTQQTASKYWKHIYWAHFMGP